MKGVCVICGQESVSRLKLGRCSGCYLYARRHGRDKVVAQGRPASSLEDDGRRRECCTCKKMLPVGSFAPRRFTSPRPMSCKACSYLVGEQLGVDEQRRRRAENRSSHYGLDAAGLLALWEAQGRACAICSHAGSIESLCIDHDHATSEVRGLLCQPCNKLLGFARDDVERLRKAAEYLRRPPAQAAVSPPAATV